jgi:NADPH:quinone reductase-like Zn-dependent oxidoreductase
VKAIVLNSFGSTNELVYQDIPTPSLLPDEVLVKVEDISINPVDVKTRKGKGQAARLKDQHPMILGWDISGRIIRTGKNVSAFKAGDDVFGMVNLPGHGKAYAEFVAAPAAHLSLKPANISHAEAAAASLAAITAWQALVKHGNVQPGQKVLIHAASGGVGHYAVQIAKYLGAHVIGTSSGANREFVLNIGADEHIDYTWQPFEQVSPQVDFILDTIGGENIDRSLKVLKPGGTIVSLPSGLSETVSEKARAQGKNGIFFLVESDGHDMQKIASLLHKGVIRSFVSKIYSFDEMKSAHLQVETGKTKGKIIVSMKQTD